MSPNRIDVHTHLIPPFWADELKTHGGDPSGWGAPEWSPEQLLRFMEDVGIATSVLSLTAPGIEGWHGSDRIDIARRVNDYGANLIKEQPERFGYLATLPLPDVAASLAEIRRCFDTLGVDGICLHSNFDGQYLGDPAFDQIWAELEQRRAVVLIHPTTPPGVKVLSGQPSPMEDYPADTTKCAFDLVCAGHLDRYPSLRIILAHGGGFLPYVATRLAELRASLHPDRSADQLLASMKKFFFDTALVAPSGMPSLLAFTDVDHIVFGTDYPYASESVSKTFTSNLDHYTGLEPEELRIINRRAETLFPRLANAS